MFGLSTSLLASAAIAVASAALAGWAGYELRDAEADEADLARMVNQQAAERLRRQNADTAAVAYEVDRSAIRAEFVTITERLENEIQTERVVYSNVCIAPGGLQQLADAARATGHTGQPGQPVPTVTPPD